MSHIKKTLAVAALALAGFGTAHAGTTYLLPDPGSPGVFDLTWTIVDNSKAKKDTDFDDFYAFNVLDAMNVSFNVAFDGDESKKATFAGYALYDYANGTLLALEPSSGLSMQSETYTLGSGVYEFEIAGTYGKKGVDYSGTITGVPVVPEPATWGLMLAGIGAIGAMARRRKQA